MKSHTLTAVAATLSILFGSTLCSAQTLEQAVATTLATNPDLKSAFNKFKSREADNASSQGKYLPTIDLDAGIGLEALDPAESNSKEATSMTRKEATVSLSQLIWDGSNTLNDINRTESEAESDRFQLLATASDTALEVAKTYLDAAQANEVLKLSEANLATHKKIYNDIRRRAESGLGSTADVTQVEARIAKAQANLLAAQNNLMDTYTTFKRLVGQAPLGLTIPSADDKALPLTYDGALDRAFEQHPTIKVSQSDVLAARYQYEQAKSANKPTVSFEASHSIRDDAGGYEGISNETTAMLRFRYNLFNGGSDKADIESASYKLNQAKDLRESAFRQVEEGLKLSWNAHNFAEQQSAFLSDHVDSVSKTVIAYEKQYQIGQRTLLDLLNSENELFEARKDYLDAKYTEQYAKYRLMNATGDLLSALRVEIPEEWKGAQG